MRIITAESELAFRIIHCKNIRYLVLSLPAFVIPRGQRAAEVSPGPSECCKILRRKVYRMNRVNDLL